MTNFIKKYFGWIVAALGAILGFLFCINHERAKLAQLKADVVVTRKKRKIAQLKKKRATLDIQDADMIRKDREILQRIKRNIAEIDFVRERSKTLSNEQVVSQFNDLYNSGDSGEVAI